MANIDTYLQQILAAIYGEEVRGSIHDAIEAINDQVDAAEETMEQFVQGAMDTTLTSTTKPAQGKAVGDAVDDLKSALNATEIVDLGNRTLQQGFITNNSINYAANGYFCIVDIGKISKVSITAGSSAACYGFLRSFTYGSSVDFSTATGFTSRIFVSAGNTVNYEKPNDANYLYIQMENAGTNLAPAKVVIDGYNIVASTLHNIIAVEKDISDLQAGNAELNAKHTVLQNMVNGTEAVLLKDRQLSKGFLAADSINYATNAHFVVIDVISGQKITVGAGDVATNIAVLKSFTYGEAPIFSEEEGFTGRITIPANQTRNYIIPSDGKYLIILMDNVGSSLAPISLIIDKYDICKNIPNNYNDIFSEFDYKVSVKKPTNFTCQTMNGVVFSVDVMGNQSVIGTPTLSTTWYSASFLQKENAKAVLTGKPAGAGSQYWIRLQESSDGNEYLFASDANQSNSNDSYFNLEAGKYYRLVFGITSNAIGNALNLSFKATLFAGGYIKETSQDVEEEDGLTDIIIPNIVDTMEGHETNIYFDTLSRYDGMEGQYQINGITKGMYRNNYCTRFTPGASTNTWYLNFSRINKNTGLVQETKQVYFNVNHPLETSLTKNVMIMGDSLTDADTTAGEVYRMLGVDADCTINRIGTLGSSGSENEGRSGWRWRDYISPSGTYQTNYTNPFWDTENNRLDFQKYCQTNGYSGLDYVLINLGTNDAIPADVMDSPNGYSSVIANAKTFLTALLSSDYGYPDCKVAIALLGIGPEYSARIFENANVFRKKFNMLNVAYLLEFDNGIWNPNVTCFALGSSTNRKYGYGYTEEPISARFSQLTIQEDDLGIHPSTAGYLSWADAYYCKIRTWLTEDSQ